MQKQSDPDSPLLPWPSEWGKPRPTAGMVFVLVVFAVMSVAFVPYVVEAGRSGNQLRAAFGLAGIAIGLTFVLVALPHMRTRMKRLPADIGVGSTGLTLQYLEGWRRIATVWFVAGASFLTIRAAIVVSRITSSDYTDREGRRLVDIGELALVVGAAGLLVFLPFYMLSGRHRRGSVVLDLRGLTQRVGHSSLHIAWDDIQEVSPTLSNSARVVQLAPKESSSIEVDTGTSRFDRWSRSLMGRSIDIPAWVLGIDPPLLLHLIRHYWNHPEDRTELSTSAVLDRMQNGELTR